jgi:TrpR-related protein YerC/YecD
LRDLMTEVEIIDFSQRLDVAMRLRKWESYKQIENITGVSSTTIARVGKFLNGEYWGYKVVLDRMEVE